MSTKIEFVKAAEDEMPICPHCRQEIREVKYAERGVLNRKLMFWCASCRCLLGTGTQFNG